MATEVGRKDSTLVERLFSQASRFDFFQLISGGEWVVREVNEYSGSRDKDPSPEKTQYKIELTHLNLLKEN